MINSVSKNPLDRKNNFSFDPKLSLGLKHFKSEAIENQSSTEKLYLIETTNSIILQKCDPTKDRDVLVYDNNPSNQKIIDRIKSAWEWEAQEELIATAKVVDNWLLIMDCNLKIWQAAFDEPNEENLPLGPAKRLMVLVCLD